MWGLSSRFLKTGMLLTAPLALAATLTASPAGAAVFLLQSSAYDVGVNLTILGGITATIGPFVEAGGIAPPAYNSTDTLLSADGSAALKLAGLTLASIGVTTGVVSATASSPSTPPTSTASSSIADLALGISTGLIPSTLLSIGASAITSTSSADGTTHPVTVSGSSSVADLTIGGTLLGGTTIDLSGTVNAPVNDVIFDLLGITITLNQQIVNTGPNGASIETNALAIDFDHVGLGLNVLNGDIIIGNSFASAPEPATWVEMLAGFTGIAFLVAVRRKRKQAAAA
jgi:hypothetical protein